MRFIQNLLPLLEKAPFPRVVSVFAPGRLAEGKLILDDLGMKETYGILLGVSHASFMNSFFLEELAIRHPTVTFIHSYPGGVLTPEWKSGDFPPPLKWFLVNVFVPIVKLFTIPLEECGDRMLFLALSGRYTPKRFTAGTDTAPESERVLSLPKGMEIALGSDGEIGSGCYCTWWTCDIVKDLSALARQRSLGARELIWEHTTAVLRDI
jgi:hypothetical protein